MNKRQQRKLVHLMVKDEKRVLLNYGMDTLRRAYMQQYAWFLYYRFIRLEDRIALKESSDKATSLMVKEAFRIVRHRRTCGKEFGASKMYIKLKPNRDEE